MVLLLPETKAAYLQHSKYFQPLSTACFDHTPLPRMGWGGRNESTFVYCQGARSCGCQASRLGVRKADYL